MISLPYSYSCHLLNCLTTFRNLNGEKLSPNTAKNENVPRSHYIKVAVAEVGYALITMIATVETFAYAVLMILSMPIYPLSKKPARLFHLLLDSSAESTDRAFKSLYDNLFQKDMPTSESLSSIRATYTELLGLIQENELLRAKLIPELEQLRHEKEYIPLKLT